LDAIPELTKLSHRHLATSDPFLRVSLGRRRDGPPQSAKSLARSRMGRFTVSKLEKLLWHVLDFFWRWNRLT
jgi:hypothetical protein